ncbi:hypothetical protein CCMA1212_009026 [Trichoderma ghanense]|uniref:Uncharacterized protein n=1 Tax=Trichoderma ghanense TaxID=65468 RepID=A0ABY2GW79_9HYPO
MPQTRQQHRLVSLINALDSSHVQRSSSKHPNAKARAPGDKLLPKTDLALAPQGPVVLRSLYEVVISAMAPHVNWTFA